MVATIPFHTSGGLIDLAALKDRDFSAEALGDALAKVNRFGGRTRKPWSVAAHSLLVEWLCPNAEFKAWALLHDAHEAFLGDITNPAVELICHAGTRSAVENAIGNAKGRLDRQIGRAWGCLPRSHSLEVRRADWVALMAETVFWFGDSPVELDPADRPEVLNAIAVLPTLPMGGAWEGARDAWIARARQLAAAGLLVLPRDCPPDGNPAAGQIDPKGQS